LATADGSYTPGLVACGHVTTVAARKSRTFRGILVVYTVPYFGYEGKPGEEHNLVLKIPL